MRASAWSEVYKGQARHRGPGSARGSGAHTVTLGSLSKSHGMAGWRLGYAAAPKALMAELAKVQDTILICAPQLTQHAGVAALEAGSGWCLERIATLAERRTQVLQALEQPEAPWRLMAPPGGTFMPCRT